MLLLYDYNPGRTTIASIATIKIIAGSVLISPSQRYFLRKKKEGVLSPILTHSHYTLARRFFFIVALAKLVVLPGL